MELALILVGGAIVLLSAPLYLASKTNLPVLDRLGLFATLAVIRVWGVNAREEYVRAMMAILHQESKGDPNHYVGDLSALTGPSIGPWQVSRQTAKDLKLWAPNPGSTDYEERQEYLSLAHHEFLSAQWGAYVLRSKLDDAQGNIEDAIRRYNGSGVSAEQYRDRAVAWMRATWGAKAGV